MNKLSLKAQERTILGKKVKKLRKDGLLPGHVFGKKVETGHVTVNAREFLEIFHQAGETGLINLRIGEEKIRPVMVRGVQYDPVTDDAIHIDFYQVNLTEKVKVPVPLVLVGEQPESVGLGEAIVLQTLNEIEVEALPTDLVEKIEVNISSLKNVDDAVTIGQLNFDRSKLTVYAQDEDIVVKLAPAVSEEMKKMMEEEAAAAVAAAAAAGGAEGKAPAESEEIKEGEAVSEEAEENQSTENTEQSKTSEEK